MTDKMRTTDPLLVRTYRRGRDAAGVVHVHRRDWRPCPATMPPPMQPTKPVAVWLYRWAEAIQHQETFEAFVAEVQR